MAKLSAYAEDSIFDGMICRIVGWTLLIFLNVAVGCKVPEKRIWLVSSQVSFKESQDQIAERKRQGLKQRCFDHNHYMTFPEQLHRLPTKTIKMEFHFLNTADSSLNFVGEEAVRFAREIVHANNEAWLNNKQMWLPLGNNTPVLPVKIQAMIFPNPEDPTDIGVYTHFDDSLYYFVSRGANRNNFSPAVFDAFKKRDSVLSVMVMPHHRDSIISPTYVPHVSGISLNQGIKIAGLFENNKRQGWEGRGLLGHELGHALGLSHTWPGYDGCDDTPAHSNCWNFTDEPPCDTEVSNNLMDYNPHQTALSPCQIAKMHLLLNRYGSFQRSFVLHDWCILDTTKTIVVTNIEEWSGSTDLYGNLIVSSGAELTIHCRVSMPQGGKIVVEPGAKLILDNAWIHQSCHGTWQGIELVQKDRRMGEVIIIGEVRLDHCQYCPELNPVLNRP